MSDPNLSFEFQQGGDYVRAASQASASAHGRCTVRTLQFFCRLSFAATWFPITDPLDPTVITGAQLPQGTFTVSAT